MAKVQSRRKLSDLSSNSFIKLNAMHIMAKEEMCKGLFTWSGGPQSSGVGFFCFHALGDTKQKKPTLLDRGPPLHVNRVLVKLWIYENHVWELRGEELYERRSSGIIYFK